MGSLEVVKTPRQTRERRECQETKTARRLCSLAVCDGNLQSLRTASVRQEPTSMPAQGDRTDVAADWNSIRGRTGCQGQDVTAPGPLHGRSLEVVKFARRQGSRRQCQTDQPNSPGTTALMKADARDISSRRNSSSKGADVNAGTQTAERL